MDAQDQAQRSPEGTEPPNSAPPINQADASPSVAYPPPYVPPASNPSTSTMPAILPPPLAAGPVEPPEPAQGRRISRADALDLLGRLKTTLIAGSVLAFGMFAALAASHITGVTSRSSSSTPASGGSQGSQAAPAATAPSSESNDDGGFFNQNSPNGFGIGAPSAQPPVSNTSVS